MIIALLTMGTKESIEPYIALGLSLKEAGHTIRIAALEGYSEFIKKFGLEYYRVSADLFKILFDDKPEDYININNPIKAFKGFKNKTIMSMILEMQYDYWDACDDVDAVIYHPGALIGYFIGKQKKIPSILASLFPITPTKAYPSIFYNKLRLGKGFNFLTHKIFERELWSSLSLPIKKFWENEFDMRNDKFSSPFSKQNIKALNTLVCCSNHIFPKPQDVGDNVHIDGYWFLNDNDDFKSKRELANFLKKGNPPIYVDIESICHRENEDKIIKIVIDGLKLSNKRGILRIAKNKEKNKRLNKKNSQDIFFVEDISNSWLLPQVAAVIHNGGYGIIASCLNAGVPSISIPSCEDEFAWARRMYELNVASLPIRRRMLTYKKLSSAIDFVLKKDILSNAKVMAKKIKNENGTLKSAKLIMDIIGNFKKT